MNLLTDYVFVITSTIITTPLYSLIDNKTRYEQTLETIESIRKRVPNSYILLIDNSPLTEDLIKVLQSKVEKFISIADRLIVKEFNNNAMKGQGETYMMAVALDFIKHNLTCKRIFKISGRYKLTDKFNINDYDSLYGKYVYRTRDASKYIKGAMHFHSRIWSVCGSLVDDAILFLERVMMTMMIQNVDVEHAAFRSMDLNKCVEFDIMGLEGYLAIWNILAVD